MTLKQWEKTVRKITGYVFLILIFSIIFAVLQGEFSISAIGIGLIISFITILVTNLLLKEQYQKLFSIRIIFFIPYVIYLIKEIFISGVKSSYMVLSGNAEMEFIQYKSSLENDLLLNILSNSITLTPGTITVNRQSGNLHIIRLYSNKKPNNKDIEGFERVISKMALKERLE